LEGLLAGGCGAVKIIPSRFTADYGLARVIWTSLGAYGFLAQVAPRVRVIPW
jgi:hypothetical protein